MEDDAPRAVRTDRPGMAWHGMAPFQGLFPENRLSTVARLFVGTKSPGGPMRDHPLAGPDMYV